MVKKNIRSYPVFIRKTPDGALFERGIVKFKVFGEEAYDIAKKLGVLINENTDQIEIYSHFSLHQQSFVKALIKELLKRNIFYIAKNNEEANSSSAEDIFYWHFNITSQKQRKIFCRLKLLVIGDNTLSNYLINFLTSSGFCNIKIISDPTLNNRDNAIYKSPHSYESECLDLFLKKTKVNYDCIICTSDFNIQSRFNFWNEFCLKHHCDYFPINVDNLHGNIGPYIVPKETACYECFLIRDNLKLNTFSVSAAEEFLHRPSINGYHPLMPAITASIAVMKLVLIKTTLTNEHIGKYTYINFAKQEIIKHKILHIPSCKACNYD